MNITREVDGLNGLVTITIEKADYESTVGSVLKDYRKKANIPGFRPGKVPEGLIKKMYGKAALIDEVNKLLSNNLTQYIKNENLNILGEPLPNEEKQPEIDWNKDETFQFVIDIALAPEFEINLTKRNKFPYYKINVSDEEINKQVETYTNRFGENKVVDEVASEKDLIRGDFVQLDSEGNEVPDGIKAERVVIAIDIIKDEAVKNGFIGKKAGDVVVFDPVKAFENRHEISHMLNISHEEAEKVEGDFSYTIIEALRFEPAELNEDFFTKAFGEESDIKTEEAFRKFIGENMEKNHSFSSDYKFGIDAKAAMIDKIKMELPEDFLKRWIKAMNKEMTEEQVDSEFPEIIKDIRWQLISGKISKDNNIEISRDDVKTAAEEKAFSQFRQYGIYNVTDSMIEHYANEILKNEKEVHQLYRRLENDRVFNFIKSKVALDEKVVSYEEFMEFLK